MRTAPVPLHFSKYVCIRVCVWGGGDGKRGTIAPPFLINVGPGLIIKKFYTIVFNVNM